MSDFYLRIGVPLDAPSPLFFASLAAAIWLVYLFCERKFAERIVTGSNDYIYQLLPQYLATKEEYFRGFLIYFGTMALFVTLLSLIGPHNLEPLHILQPKEISDLAVPLIIAFVLMGALPNVPGLVLIEKLLRQYAHERAYIPHAARATAERLAAADFDFSSYAKEALRSPEMRGVKPEDFTRPRYSLELAWARLCCLIFVQKSVRMEHVFDSLDAGLLRDYESDLELIESQKQSMETQVATYRKMRARDPSYSNETLRRDIADKLYKLYILLGCAVRLKAQPREDIDRALRPLGFKLAHAARREDTRDLKLMGLAAVAASAGLLDLAGAGLGQLGLWQMSPVFPQTVFQPFVDTASALVPYATAITIADLMRRHLVNKGSWFGAHGARRTSSANYVRVAAVCGVAGYVGLILWGLALAPPTQDSFKIEIPYALLAMVTGGFYVYHLDNAEMGRRPSRPWILGAQGILTGLCGLIAAFGTWQVIFGTASVAIDKIILTAVISAAAGLALAWYIPKAAAATLYDPLTEASNERIQAVETASQERLGPAMAASWLDKELAILKGKSPRAAAAANVEGLEHAISLLQGPQTATAIGFLADRDRNPVAHDLVDPDRRMLNDRVNPASLAADSEALDSSVNL
jgi:hypothetical protein